ncbi:MAG: hypothetical protein IKM44_04510 [Clostridia bacterium]|nr:hypothetical protein [Clostridia bacterium]
MKKYISTIFKGMPYVYGISAKIDEAMESLSLNFHADTKTAIETMIKMVDVKRQLVDVATAYEEMINCLTDDESEALDGRYNGVSDGIIANTLGVSRNTVIALRHSALVKCAVTLERLKKTGVDVSKATDALALLSTAIESNKKRRKN